MSINKIIFMLSVSIILVLTLASALQEPLVYYKLDCHYDNGKISINSTSIEFLDKEINIVGGNYLVNILDSNENIVKTLNFSVPNKVLYDNIDANGTIIDGGEEELNQTSFDLYIPYNQNAKEIVISYGDKELTRQDVSMYSKNNIITSNPISEKAIDKNKVVENSNNNQTPKSIFIEYWWILLVGLILVVFIVYFIKRKI